MIEQNLLSRAFVVALIYLAFGALWIVATDIGAFRFFDDQEMWVEVQLIKGLLFVFLSSVVVFFLHLAFTKRMRTLNSQFQILFNQEKFGLLMSDHQGNIIDASPNIPKMLGYKRKELIGTSIREITPPKHVDSDLVWYKKLVNQEIDDYAVEKSYIHKDGFLIPVRLIGSVKRNKKGSIEYFITAVEDITEQQAHKTQIEQEKRFIELTLEHLPIGISVHRTDTGERTLMNKNFSKVYGWPEDTLTDVDSFFEHVYPDPAYRQQIKTQIFNDMASGDVDRMRWPNIAITTETGEKRIVNAVNIPVPHKNLLISTVDDVTEKYYAQQIVLESKHQLEALNKELLRSNRELEEFAYVASHDLQEPLRMVSQFTQMLEKKYGHEITPEASKYISYAVEGAKRMQTMINDLLEYSRVTNTDEKFRLIDAGTIIERACQMLAIRIDNAGAQIKYQALPEIYVSPSLMERLFMNIIENSIKYRSDEAPIIEITHVQKGEFFEFSVRDNGIGIDPVFADKIFVIFQRLHKRDDYQGTGIGLSICKRIIERHGGRIWLDDTPIGKGTAFKFTLPIQAKLEL
jgi:PAS domain S-box-containing protein